MAIKFFPANVQIVDASGKPTREFVKAMNEVLHKLGGGSTIGPGDVTGLTATGIEHGYRIAGTLPNNRDLSYVEVWMSSDAILANATRITWGLASTYDQLGFSASDGTKYFWVRCVDTAGREGNFVGPVSAVAGITSTPGSVTNLAATSIIGGIRVSATLPADADLAYVELWMGATSVLGSATRITWGLASSYDQLGLLPTDGTRYFWARCVNTSGGIGAYVGPASATAGQAQSGNIADAAVTVAKFASSLEPVTIVSSVPGVLSTKTVFNTADGKLYRWNGSAYVKTVTAGDIAANAVTAGTIAAGAVTATEISVSSLAAINALLGNATIDASGSLKGGQTAYDTGIGFFLGYSGGAYKFSLGNSAGNKLTWDGSTLSVTGSISVASLTSGTFPSVTYGGTFRVDACSISSGSFGTLSASSVTSNTLESQVATGTAPLVVASTTKVTNLNADLLDGSDSSAFATSGHNHSGTYLTVGGTAADSSALGGYAASNWTRIVNGNVGTANASGSGFTMQMGTGLAPTYEVACSGNNIILQTASDRRLKQNIDPEELGLDFILALAELAKQFRFISDPSRLQHGWVADDVMALVGSDATDALVFTNPNGMKGVNHLMVISILTKAVSTLHQRIAALEARP